MVDIEARQRRLPNSAARRPLTAAITQIRASPELVDAVVREGFVVTLHKRKAGSKQLWKFMDELKGLNMLRLFGIKPE